MYPDDGCPVLCTECFNGDGWNPLDFGRDIEWNVPFFEQWRKVLAATPRHYNYRSGTIVNSDYANYSVNNKDAYLCFSVTDCENVSYSENIDTSKDSFDNLGVQSINNSSWNVDVEGNFNCQWALQTKASIDCLFIFDCDNCQNCTLSSNLRNQSYYFRNQKVSKEEYQKLVAELALNTRAGMERTRKEYMELIKHSIARYANIFTSRNATGDFISNSRDVRDSFDVHDGENITHSNRIIHAKDCHDAYGILNGELQYETLAGSVQSYNIRFSIICLTCKNMQYSVFCRNCSDCFGCVGLKDRQHCILNKQYSKEEYEKLLPQLIAQMAEHPYVDSNGRIYPYGEFFPPAMSLFGYNETTASEYFPITQEAALAKGYRWKEREKRDYAITISNADIPEDIKTVDDMITKEVIECGHGGTCEHQCSTAFRITPEELSFLRHKSLALPVLCPNCRHYARVQLRNPMRLWRRTCMCAKVGHIHQGKCPNEFETSYAPDRLETVYCEQCYQAEVA
jgi:hypothetical protein